MRSSRLIQLGAIKPRALTVSIHQVGACEVCIREVGVAEGRSRQVCPLQTSPDNKEGVLSPMHDLTHPAHQQMYGLKDLQKTIMQTTRSSRRKIE